MRMPRERNNCPVCYIKNIALESIPGFKYLGIQITADLTRTTDLDYFVNDDNRTVFYLTHNMFMAPVSLELVLYETLVRIITECAAPVLKPGLINSI